MTRDSGLDPILGPWMRRSAPTAPDDLLGRVMTEVETMAQRPAAGTAWFTATPAHTFMTATAFVAALALAVGIYIGTVGFGPPAGTDASASAEASPTLAPTEPSGAWLDGTETCALDVERTDRNEVTVWVCDLTVPGTDLSGTLTYQWTVEFGVASTIEGPADPDWGVLWHGTATLETEGATWSGPIVAARPQLIGTCCGNAYVEIFRRAPTSLRLMGSGGGVDRLLALDLPDCPDPGGGSAACDVRVWVAEADAVGTETCRLAATSGLPETLAWSCDVVLVSPGISGTMLYEWEVVPQVEVPSGWHDETELLPNAVRAATVTLTTADGTWSGRSEAADWLSAIGTDGAVAPYRAPARVTLRDGGGAVLTILVPAGPAPTDGEGVASEVISNVRLP